METDENYWDCECMHEFIHSKKLGNFCPNCHTFSDDQPDSMVKEVDLFYNKDKDSALLK